MDYSRARRDLLSIRTRGEKGRGALDRRLALLDWAACGRFTLTYRDRERLAAELGVPVEQIPKSDYRPRYNIAPTDPHWILRQRYEERFSRRPSRRR